MIEYKLVELNLEDAESMAKHANNEKIPKYMGKIFPYPYTAPDAEDFISMVIEGYETPNFTKREFGIKINGEVVGVIGYNQKTDIRDHIAVAGYWISEDYWGKGIVTRAFRELCDFIFTNTKVIRIEADAFAENIASTRVMEKVGFKKESVLKNGFNKYGKYYDVALYILFKEDFYNK